MTSLLLWIAIQLKTIYFFHAVDYFSGKWCSSPLSIDSHMRFMVFVLQQMLSVSSFWFHSYIQEFDISILNFIILQLKLITKIIFYFALPFCDCDRWRGSLYKLIWRELLAYLALYYTINVMYRYVLTEDQKR